jgi:hypothetical protein
MRVSPTYSPGEAMPSLLVAMGLTEQPSGNTPGWLVRALSTISLMWPLVVVARLGIFLLLCGGALRHWLSQDMVAGIGLLTLLSTVDLAIMLVPRLGMLRHRPPHIKLRVLIPLIFASALLYALLGHLVIAPGTPGRDITLLFAII